MYVWDVSFILKKNHFFQYFFYSYAKNDFLFIKTGQIFYHPLLLETKESPMYQWVPYLDVNTKRVNDFHFQWSP